MVVVGGYDGDKKVFVMVDVYDVDMNFWLCLCSMCDECDELIGVIFDGKFFVVSGYGSEF